MDKTRETTLDELLEFYITRDTPINIIHTSNEGLGTTRP